MTFTQKLFALFLLLNGLLAFSQQSQLTIGVSEKIQARNGELLTLMVKVHNPSAQKRQIVLRSSAAKTLRLLNSEVNAEVEAGGHFFIPVKIFVEKTHPAGSEPVYFEAVNDLGSVAARASTSIVVDRLRDLKITSDEPQILIYRAGDSLKVTATIHNNGNRLEKAEISAAFPLIFGTDDIETATVTLQPFSRKKVTFRRFIDQDLLQREYFSVNIRGRDEEKTYFGSVSILVQNALGSRRYVDPLIPYQSDYNHTNQITWTTRNPFSSSQAAHVVNANAEINVGDVKTRLMVNGQYWSQQSTLLFNNTGLGFSYRNFSGEVGNINTGNLEINLMGRGVKAQYGNPAKDKYSISAGAVEKNHNLFGAFSGISLYRGYGGFAQANINLTDEIQTETQMLWDSDMLQRNFIVKSGLRYSDGANTLYRAAFGVGLSQPLNSELDGKSAVKAELEIRKTWRKYSGSLTASHSGSYYPGLSRGSTIIDQRISRSLEKMTVYGAFNFSYFDPQYFEIYNSFSSFSRRTRLQAGATFNLLQGFNVNVFGERSAEETAFYSDSNQRLPFNTVLMSSALQYAARGSRHRLSGDFSAGVSYLTDLPGSNDFIYRLRAGWYYKSFMINANYQHGEFMVHERVNRRFTSEVAEKLSLAAAYNFNPMMGRFNFSLTGMAVLDRQMGNSLSFNSTADFRLYRSGKIFANVQYNVFLRNSFRSSQPFYQVGFTQDLPKMGEEPVPYKNGTLQVFMFYDQNNNHIYDPDTDQPAPLKRVNINNTAFVSDSKGYIQYRKVPYGSYKVSSTETEWFSTEVVAEVNDKKNLILLSLQKTGLVTGRIVYQKSTRTQYEVLEILAGIPVIFTNTFGKSFTVYTNAKGEYQAFLPIGTYTAAIETEVLQRHVYMDQNAQTVSAIENDTAVLQDFELKVREKKVQLRKFGEPNE